MYPTIKSFNVAINVENTNSIVTKSEGGGRGGRGKYLLLTNFARFFKRLPEAPGLIFIHGESGCALLEFSILASGKSSIERRIAGDEKRKHRSVSPPPR